MQKDIKSEIPQGYIVYILAINAVVMNFNISKFFKICPLHNRGLSVMSIESQEFRKRKYLSRSYTFQPVAAGMVLMYTLSVLMLKSFPTLYCTTK